MSNDSEVLHKIGAPTSIIMNGESQTYKTLRDSIRAIYLAVRYGKPESENVTWIEAREAELEGIQDVIDNIREDNEFSTFLSVFRDAKTLIDVKKKDIKGGWDFNINGFQYAHPLTFSDVVSDITREWTDLHYGEVSIPGQASRKMTFWVKYSRDHYGRWKQDIINQSEGGQLWHLDNFVSDKEFGNTVSRFEQGRPKCMCHEDHPNPKPHLFVSQDQIEAIHRREQETINWFKPFSSSPSRAAEVT